jgi:hypothetical protein
MHLRNYGVVPNFVEEESRIFHFSTGLWEAIGGEGIEFFRYTGPDIDEIQHAALGVSVYETAVAGASVGPFDIPHFYRTAPVRGHFMIKLDAAAYVVGGITIEGEGAGVWASNEEPGQLVGPNKWTLISAESDGIENPNPSASCTATLVVVVSWIDDEYAGAQNFYVKWPTISVPNAATLNISAAETFIRLPEYMRNADATETEPNFPFFKFIDAITPVAHSIDQKWGEYRYIPAELNDGVIKPSALVDVNTAGEPEVKWLSQFFGVDLVDPRSGATSWGSLLSAADAAGDNSGEASWAELETLLDEDDPTDGVQWDEVQNFAIDTDFSPELLLAFSRWQVESAVYGLRGGTTASLIEAARKGLKTVDASVVVVPHYEDDPFKIAVQVASADMITQIDDVQILINPAIPLGYEVVAVAV